MKCVIFDLDGTLIDSRDDIAASINHVRAECYGLPPLSPSVVSEAMNRMDLDLARFFYGTDGYGEEARERFEAHYARQCLRNARPFEGVPETLARLAEEGWRLFVATNAPSHTSRAMLQKHNLLEFFDDIVGADRVIRAKPDPEMVETIVGKGPFDEVWMVGDSPKDIAAARAAGVRPLFAAWGYSGRLPYGFGGVPALARPGRLPAFLARAGAPPPTQSKDDDDQRGTR
ncbi:HAD family hydrolase [Hydrogenimonas sp.]